MLRPDQLEEEFKGCLALAKYCLGTVGLLDKCTFRFSQWDPSNPNNKYEGTAGAVGARPEHHGQDPGRPGRSLLHRHRRGRLLRTQAGYPV